MIQNIKDDIKNLSIELKETRALISQYNGLRKSINKIEGKLNKVQERIYERENQKMGRYQVFEGIRQWIPWLIAIITLLARLWGWI